MDKDNQIQKVPKLSLEKLSEDSKLVKRGLRDLNVWPKIEDIFNELKEKYQAGQIDECIKLCIEVLDTDPNHFFTLCYYGRCLYQKDEFEKSAESLTQCLNEENQYFFL
jgi:tetratricopeptide (TPR) repeat protein